MRNPILDMRQGDLPPTATYARRRWLFLPAVHEITPDGRDGTLTLIIQKGERNGRAKPVNVEVDHYGVYVEPDPEGKMPPGVRAFTLMNDKSPEEEGEDREEMYRCVVGGMVETCTCSAGGYDRPRMVERQTSCKHRAACRALCEEGVI